MQKADIKNYLPFYPYMLRMHIGMTYSGPNLCDAIMGRAIHIVYILALTKKYAGSVGRKGKLLAVHRRTLPGSRLYWSLAFRT